MESLPTASISQNKAERLLEAVDYLRQHAGFELASIVEGRSHELGSDFLCETCPENKNLISCGSHYWKFLDSLETLIREVPNLFSSRDPRSLEEVRKHFIMWHHDHTGEGMDPNSRIESDFDNARVLAHQIFEICEAMLASFANPIEYFFEGTKKDLKEIFFKGSPPQTAPTRWFETLDKDPRVAVTKSGEQRGEARVYMVNRKGASEINEIRISKNMKNNVMYSND
ncbi:hypothetical protein OAL44_00615 [Planctomycetaceae bacterium]|nr:hypothetical protein [Planctomycetaceae bacterium]